MTTRAYYTHEPQKLEAVGNGSFLYRYDIVREVDAAPPCMESQGHTEQWSCMEVTVWEPLTANKITEAVIASGCPANHEQTLVNEYNAAQLGMIGGSKTSGEAGAKIAAYKDFLERRNALKAQIDEDCSALGIS